MIRRFLRTFFAHRAWLVFLLLIGGLTALSASFLQERIYAGRIELASANEGAPTRVLLPDNARLWQLVHDQDNLRMLIPGTESETETIDHQVTLTPVSTQPNGSSVWSLRVAISADNPTSAKELLDRYADRINTEFRDQTLLVRQSERNEDALLADSKTAGANQRISVRSTSAKMPVEIPVRGETAPADDPQIAALAQELGVDVSRLPYIVDQFRESLDRRMQTLAQREGEIDRIVATINQIETNSKGVQLSADLEAAHPEIRSLRQQRDTLLAERTRLSSYLRPAHPEYQAVEKSLADSEEKLHAALVDVARYYRSEVQRMETDLKKERDLLSRDRQRYERVCEQLGISTEPEVPAPTTVYVTPPAVSGSNSPATTDEEATVPLPLPNALTAMPFERPVGRVVIRKGNIEPMPIQPRTVRNVVLGLGIALLGYLIAITFRSATDQRIMGVDDLEALPIELNVFGSIPRQRRRSPVRFAHGQEF